MISVAEVQEFLDGRRIAVIGASDEKANFGRTIVHELAERGYDVVAVHPHASSVDGRPCYPDVGTVPGELDRAIVMVDRARSADVVDQCIARGVDHVWLFRGVGGAGAVSDDAVRRCRDHHVAVVAGACPLMFLEPVGVVHRVHRFVRRRNGSLESARAARAARA